MFLFCSFDKISIYNFETEEEVCEKMSNNTVSILY